MHAQYVLVINSIYSKPSSERLNVDHVVVPAGSESTGRASMKSSGVLVVPEGVKRGT